MRNRDEFADHDLLMDAQISGNTPVVEPSSVKTVHIDSNNKLLTGLLYLRAPEDDSVGGDLDIVRFRRDLSPGQTSAATTGYSSTIPLSSTFAPSPTPRTR